jgi:uncharacterized protein (DUF2235 family)
MKRIAIFCDGTWNTPDKMEDGKYCQTNVVKLAGALAAASDDGTLQILYYDNGVGSEGNILKQVFDGATGTGISEKILQAYRFIINNYKPGDELYLFGFSRGAFTVRSLSGLIRNSGILQIENMDKVPKAYKIYRSRRAEYQPREIEATLFRKTYAVEECTNIKFIGVWDTVGALGNPLMLNGFFSKKNQFHDTELSSRVSHAYHALAIDEKRKNFEATLWHQQPGTTGQVLEQVWFPGVHSDVGGGFSIGQSGLSDIALQWMMKKAQDCNLKFNSIVMHPKSLAPLHESYLGFYKLINKIIRPMGIETPRKGKTNESLHPSVMEKYNKDNTYRPQNLIDYLKQNPADQ